MGLFSKHKKNNKRGNKKKTASPGADHHDLGVFDALDEGEDFSSAAYPQRSYEDYDGVDIENDVLGIGFDDDDEEKKPPEKKKSKFGLIVGGLTVLIIGGGIIAATTMDMETTTPLEQEQEAIDSRIDGGSEGIVINEELNVAYEGAENGAPVNGTGAILAFDYDYYIERDGEGAISHFNPDVTSYDAAFIQSHINKVPGQTEHRLKITPTHMGVNYDVELTLRVPGEDPLVYNQKFETMQVDGEYFVKNFTSQRVSR